MLSVPIVSPSPNATIACGIILPLVAGVLVALRFYCRHSVQRVPLLVDDWVTIPAWIFLTGMGTCLVLGMVYPNPKRSSRLILRLLGVRRRAFAYPSPQPLPSQNPATFSAPEIILNRQLEFAVQLLQLPAISCVKLSFLFFYKRVFCTPATTARIIIIWTTITLSAIWGIAFFFGFLFVCGTDFVAFWGIPLRFNAHCHRLLAENIWLSSSDFVLDVLVFIIPLPLIWKLHMSMTRKLALLTIFAVGALTLAASATRMIIYVNAVQSLKKAYKSSKTNNLTITTGLYWTTFECGLGLIASCLPPLYILLKQFWNKVFASNASLSEVKAQGKQQF
ncbi:hypothetical protein GQ43DRAFT_478558 [Delitschia confertaspora ATCC 74209]|uniref:Rhodopsin domain-containing protein n=1 Tax=Delitschia confertaspora ATCC 74209 TaxID=1513339 RepID=A0A9P4JV56_9PLEO|nr:hypothetical protein GQ43DRAFT_478558 [Delitschia confertaspora ATCC 74209]